MSDQKEPYIFVVGNEKGGAGKTTCAMHLIIGLLDNGYKVVSVDADSRQHSLTTYINNRKSYNLKNPDYKVAMSLHYHLQESGQTSLFEKEKEENSQFTEVLNQAKNHADFIVIDTPGNHTYYSRLAHSYANTIITPINDSFVDLDVIAKIDGDKLDSGKPSIYSQMVWEQKMERASRDGRSINWVLMRNRLSNIDALNKRNVAETLEKLSKRIAFTIAPGFSERVIFRELFPYGLTLLDLTKANFHKSLSISHIAARQELREFMDCLGIKSLSQAR